MRLYLNWSSKFSKIKIKQNKVHREVFAPDAFTDDSFLHYVSAKDAKSKWGF